MQQKRKKLWWVLIPIIGIVGYILYDSFSQPSIKDLAGGFEEVAFIRNEQNKGGIIRIYAVTVSDPLNAQYDQCADLFPVNDYGSITKVYFFDIYKPYPTSLTLEEPHFDTSLYQAINILKRRGVNK